MESKKYNKGDVIFKEGETGSCMYEILSGSVEIVAEKGTEFEKKLTELKKGDIFGEMAVIESSPRSATAMALESTEVAVIPGSALNDYFKEKPEKILEIMRHISGRIRALTQDYMAVCRTINESNDNKGKAKQSAGLWDKLKAFAGIYTRKGKTLSLSERDEKKQKHTEGLGKNVLYFDKGDVVFAEMDNSDCMYDIIGGTVGIYASYGKADEKLLTKLDADTFFGEMGMIDKELRSATAVALEYDTYIEKIFPEDLGEIFERRPAKILMILQHLSARLRKLTIDYLTACKTASDIIDAEEKGENLSTDAEERVKLFCSINIYGRYYT